MIYITVRDRNNQAPPRYQQLNKDNVLLGRWDGSDLVLPKNNVSKQHARLLKKEGRLIITDLQSTNKTFLNGQALAPSSPHMLKTNDRVSIGDYILELSTQPTPQHRAASQQAQQAQQPQQPKSVQGHAPTPPSPLARAQRPPKAQPFVPAKEAVRPPPIPQTPQRGWQAIAMGQGPSYSYTAIPQGWLLLAPSGDLLFLSDPKHSQPPAAMSLPAAA